jgi:hypothetical protein
MRSHVVAVDARLQQPLDDRHVRTFGGPDQPVPS